MIIDFTNRITEAKVQEMINDALDFTTGVLNLSNATADEVKTAFSDPDRWLFSYTHSGETYLEKYRRGPFASTGEYEIQFYVQGASSGQPFSRIEDGRLYVYANPTTGAVRPGSHIAYAPDIIYNLDRMTAEQLIFLEGRLRNIYSHPDNARFSAFWTYNGKRYVYAAGSIDTMTTFEITGTCFYYNRQEGVKIYYDNIYIDPNGTITHSEFVSDTTLTPVQ